MWRGVAFRHFRDARAQIGRPDTDCAVDRLVRDQATGASQQRALAIEEAVYGPEHPELASTLTNLGSLQRQLGERDGTEHAQRAVAIFERSLGPEHPTRRKRERCSPRRMTPGPA